MPFINLIVVQSRLVLTTHHYDFLIGIPFSSAAFSSAGLAESSAASCSEMLMPRCSMLGSFTGLPACPCEVVGYRPGVDPNEPDMGTCELLCCEARCGMFSGLLHNQRESHTSTGSTFTYEGCSRPSPASDFPALDMA